MFALASAFPKCEWALTHNIFSHLEVHAVSCNASYFFFTLGPLCVLTLILHRVI